MLMAPILQKEVEAALPTEEQRNMITERRKKYAPRPFTSLEAHVLKEKLKDPLIFRFTSC